MKVVTEKIITLRELTEKERKRLLGEPDTPGFKSWLGDRSYPLEWMKLRFGETLNEKDGFTYPNGNRVTDADCYVCNKPSAPDQKILRLSFSFCDEYDCGMNICAKCLQKWSKKLKVN